MLLRRVLSTTEEVFNGSQESPGTNARTNDRTDVLQWRKKDVIGRWGS